MKTYVITGSIGHISKPIIEGLLRAGNEVRVITSNNDRVTEIETLGAKALVGIRMHHLSNRYLEMQMLYTR